MQKNFYEDIKEMKRGTGDIEILIWVHITAGGCIMEVQNCHTIKESNKNKQKSQTNKQNAQV